MQFFLAAHTPSILYLRFFYLCLKQINVKFFLKHFHFFGPKKLLFQIFKKYKTKILIYLKIQNKKQPNIMLAFLYYRHILLTISENNYLKIYLIIIECCVLARTQVRNALRPAFVIKTILTRTKTAGKRHPLHFTRLI